MSDKRKQAQQDRRSREREQAAEMAASASNEAAENAPDVDPGGDEPPSLPKVDHSARMEALEALRKKPEDMDEYIREETEDSPVAPTATETTEVPEAPAPAPVAEVAPEVVTVKIDGEERQVAKGEVDALGGVASYQIHKAAEKRLEQANREKQELHNLLMQTKAMLEAQKPQAPKQDPADWLKEKATQIQFGTPEESAQALQEIMNSQRVDPNQIIQQAMEQMAQKSAAQQFVTKNSDLFQNPVLAKLAVVMEHDKLSKSRPSDWNKFYSDLEYEFRNSIGRPATTPTPTVADQPTSGQEAKLSRKDNIVNLPTAAGRIAAPEPDKPLTRDDRLNLLRKARGQPVG
jgi:hypothetical protein